MATVQNSRTLEELRNAAALQLGSDNLPTQLSNQIVPTIELNPRLTRYCNIIKQSRAANSTGSTLYTTPTDRDFYLCNASVNVVKDATSTSAYSHISVVVGGATLILAQIASLTLTTQVSSMDMTFAFPIKIDRGTTILLVNNAAAANISSSGVIVGYLVENSGA